MHNFLRYNPRTALAMLHDLVAATLAWTLAYLLRFNLEPPANFMAEMWLTLIWVVPLQSECTVGEYAQ